MDIGHTTDEAPAGSGSGDPAESWTEALREIWREVLDAPGIDDESNFFGLGGDSMVAMRLISRSRELLAVPQLAVRLIFESPMFGEFTDRVIRIRQGDFAPSPTTIPPTGRDRAPLSLQQEQLMAIERALGPSPANQVVVVAEAGTEVDTGILRVALLQTVRRHPCLRLAIVPGSVGEEQIVLPIEAEDTIPVEEVDVTGGVSGRAPGDVLDSLRRAVLRAHLKPFDLAAGRPIRTQLFRCPDRADVLVLHLHHMMLDGVSIRVLLDDLAVAYTALAEGDELAKPGEPEVRESAGGLTYLDYALWQREQAPEIVAASSAYWARAVRRLAADLARTGRPAPADGRRMNFSRSATVVGADVVGGLRAGLADVGGTEFTTLAAAIAAAFSCRTGRSCVGLGTLVANRAGEFESSVGPFATSTLVALDVDGHLSARDLVREVGAQLLEAQRWAHVPLETLLAEPAEDLGIAPSDLIDLVLSFEYIYRSGGGALPLTVVPDHDEPLVQSVLRPQRGFFAYVDDDNALRLAVEYPDSAEERHQAVTLLDDVARILGSFSRTPDVQVREVLSHATADG